MSFSYRPFLTPLPIWDYWYLLLLPLCLAVAIVYKAIRVDDLSRIPRQALVVTVWIIGGMAVAGAVLAGIVKVW